MASFLSIPLALALAVFAPFPGFLTAALLLAAVLMCLGVAVYLHVHTRDWQRYKRHAPGP